MFGKLCCSTLLIFSFSSAFADPVTHIHGDKTHTHVLPKAGMAHKHGSLPVGKSVTAHASPKKEEKEDIARAKYRRMTEGRAIFKASIDIVMSSVAYKAYSKYKTDPEKAAVFIRKDCNSRITDIINDQKKDYNVSYDGSKFTAACIASASKSYQRAVRNNISN